MKMFWLCVIIKKIEEVHPGVIFRDVSLTNCSVACWAWCMLQSKPSHGNRLCCSAMSGSSAAVPWSFKMPEKFMLKQPATAKKSEQAAKNGSGKSEECPAKKIGTTHVESHTTHWCNRTQRELICHGKTFSAGSIQFSFGQCQSRSCLLGTLLAKCGGGLVAANHVVAGAGSRVCTFLC